MADSMFAFDAYDPSGYSAMEMRRKIALQMMTQKRAYPKTLGEGLASIGDSLGDAFQMRALNDQIKAQTRSDRQGSRDAYGDPGTEPPDATGKRAEGDIPVDAPVLAEGEAVPLPTPRPDFAAVPPAQPVAATRSVAPVTVADAAPATVPDIVQTLPNGKLSGNVTGPVIPPYTPEPAVPLPVPRPAGAMGMPGTPEQGQRLAGSFDALAQPPFNANDVASENRLSEVTGMGGGNSFTYAPTASLGRTGDVASDAPPITGISPAVGAAVGDTVMQRRDDITRALQNQTAPVVPQPNPTLSAATPPPSSLGSPPEASANPPIVSDVKPMPVEPVAAPGVQTAQAAPPAVEPPYEMPKPVPPVPPIRDTSLNERERNAIKYRDGDYSPTIKEAARAAIAEEKAKKDAKHEFALKDYETKNAIYKQDEKDYGAFLRERQQKQLELKQKGLEVGALPGKLSDEEQQRQATLSKSRSEALMQGEKARLQNRFGEDPTTFLAKMDKRRDAAAQSVNTLQYAKLAKEALDAGVVTGFGAEARLNLNKLQAWLINSKKAGDLATNTELYKAAITSTVNGAVQNIQGADPKVTDADIRLAKGTIGGDINGQLGAMRRLVDHTIRTQHERINEYEDHRDHYLSGEKPFRDYQIRTDETAPKDWVARLLQHKETPAAREQFDLKFGNGAANLEIGRALRRSRHPKDYGAD